MDYEEDPSPPNREADEWRRECEKLRGRVAELEAKSKELETKSKRERLPDERQGTTHHFVVVTKCHKLKCVAGKIDDTSDICATCNGTGLEEINGYIQTGLYPDGRVGEIFVKIGQSTNKFIMLDQWAIAFSIALQYGAPLEALCTKFRGQNFWPDGPTDNDKIKRCSSLVDYCVRWLMLKYGTQETITATSTANAGVEP